MLAAAACCCCVSMVSMSFRLKAGRNASSFELAAASALASSSTSADTSSLVGCRPPLSPGEDGTRSSSPSSLILLPSGAFLSSVLSASSALMPAAGAKLGHPPISATLRFLLRSLGGWPNFAFILLDILRLMGQSPPIVSIARWPAADRRKRRDEGGGHQFLLHYLLNIGNPNHKYIVASFVTSCMICVPPSSPLFYVSRRGARCRRRYFAAIISAQLSLSLRFGWPQNIALFC